MDKLAAIKKAMEMGAEVNISFFDVKSHQDAVKVSEEFKGIGNGVFIEENKDEHNWLEFDTKQNFNIAIHYEGNSK